MIETMFNLPTKIAAKPGIYLQLPKFLNSDVNTLIITDKGLVKTGVVNRVKNILVEKKINVEIYSDVKPNPNEEVVNKINTLIKKNRFKQVIALGGGSTIDAAKAACCLSTNEGLLEDYQWNNRSFENLPLPLIAIPTTAGTGSEVTGVAVITSRNIKKGINAKEIFPKIALVDAQLMTSLPPYLTAITGMDALSHAIESYLGLKANPFTDSLAIESIKLISKFLLRAYANGNDIEARHNMAVASTMAGLSMDQAGLGIVHSLASPVCAYLHWSHGLACSILLPYGMKYNSIARRSKMAHIAELMGANISGLSEREMAQKAIECVFNLEKDLELDNIIQEKIKVKPDLDKYGKNAASMFLIKNNPRQASAQDCSEIFNEIFR